MLSQTKENSGIYILVGYASKKLSIKTKRFGALSLLPGYYLYVGSAQKNLAQRIKRHVRKDKKIFWHIDYLTSHPDIHFKNVITLTNKEKAFECDAVSILDRSFPLAYPVPGFGNSDCNMCKSHLLYSSKNICNKLLKVLPDSKFFDLSNI